MLIHNNNNASLHFSDIVESGNGSCHETFGKGYSRETGHNYIFKKATRWYKTNQLRNVQKITGELSIYLRLACNCCPVVIFWRFCTLTLNIIIK